MADMHDDEFPPKTGLSAFEHSQFAQQQQLEQDVKLVLFGLQWERTPDGLSRSIRIADGKAGLLNQAFRQEVCRQLFIADLSDPQQQRRSSTEALYSGYPMIYLDNVVSYHQDDAILSLPTKIYDALIAPKIGRYQDYLHSLTQNARNTIPLEDSIDYSAFAEPPVVSSFVTKKIEKSILSQPLKDWEKEGSGFALMLAGKGRLEGFGQNIVDYLRDRYSGLDSGQKNAIRCETQEENLRVYVPASVFYHQIQSDVVAFKSRAENPAPERR